MNNFVSRSPYSLVILCAILFIYILTLSMPEMVLAQATTNPGNPTTTSALTTTTVPTTTTSEPITTTTSVLITTTVPVTTTIPTTSTTVPSEGIPTLDEWGMIIFMTIIAGMGVVAILKRRAEKK